MTSRFLTPNADDLMSDSVGRFYFIPENLLGLFSGAVQELCYPHNFEQFGSATPEQASQVFTDILDEPMSSPIGMIVFYGSVSPPPYVLPCDGSIYDVSDYPKLAASGAVVVSGSTFTMPDYRGRFLLGASSSFPVGSEGGEEVHELTVDEMPEHEHLYTPPVFNVDLESPGAPDVLAAGVGALTQTGTAGNSTPHNNMPPYVSLSVGMFAR